MTVINRTIVINPVEATSFSMRLRSGLLNKVEVVYKKQDGSPYAADVAGQLYLIGRTTGRAQMYLMPMTDVVNGKARATIPAGDIRDANGYNIQLLGTVDTEPRLIARGFASVMLTEAMGIIPADAIDTVDLMFEYDNPVDLDVTLWKDDAKDAPYDLTAEATTVSAYVRVAPAGNILVAFAVTVLAANKIKLSLTADQVNALPAACWWSLSASTVAGLITLCQGDVTITGTITPPLGAVIFNYDYQKPDNADPIAGQIVHGNFTQDALKVAKLDSDGVDRTTDLRKVVIGTTIQVGATVWTVSGYAVESASFFQFGIQPVQQAVPSGIVPVTFTGV